MGFFRIQEENLAMRLLAWRYERMGLPVPGMSELRRQAKTIVDDAHRIARDRGRNVMSIVKEMVNDIRK
jgi:hypothetical protein